jgi:hypothetical protein
MVVFVGSCPRCAGEFTWDDLAQQLSCLEAKNVGVFGQCRRGIQMESHTFDQECAACAEEEDVDEGVDVFEPPPAVDEGQHAHQSKHKGKGGKSKSPAGRDGEDGRKKKKQRTS